MMVAYISDARDEYARTMFEKVGLPQGATVKLRYSAKRIQPPLRESLATGRLVGRDLLMCYMSGNIGDLRDAVAVASRYARVVHSERIADFFSLECELQGFPSSPQLPDLFPTADMRGLLSPGPASGLFVVEASPPSEERLAELNPERWMSVCAELTKCPFFESASFVYVEALSGPRGGRIQCAAGSFRVRGNTVVRARLHTLAITRESRLHHYEIRVDDSVIQVVEAGELSLGFGREVFDLRFVTLPIERSRPTRVRIEPGQGENGSAFSMAFDVVPRRLALVSQRVAVAASGAAAATAGVLSDQTPLWIKVALVTLGSAGLAISARGGR